MAYTPTPPTVDPSQKGPVLSGANDVPYVGKPKPQPQRAGQPPRYGSSDGSGFDFQAYLAGQHRPRPVQVLPGQGMGPMPVGTKPLPNPVVKDPRTGGGGQPPWLQGKMLPMDIGPGSANERAQAALRAEWEAKNGPWQGGPTLSTGDNRLDRGGMNRPMQISEVPQNIRDLWANGGASPFGGMQDMNGGPTSSTGDNRLNRGDMGMTTGLWNPPDRNPGENPNDYYARTRAGGGMQDMKGGLNQGGQSVAPGMGMPTQYGGPAQARDFNAPNYGAPVQRGPMQGPPQVGTGPGSMGKPQQPGGMPSREGGASHRGQRPSQAPVNPQALQQGAQALYGDNTIPHEFKGQLLQAAQSGDAQAFNDMLFNSGIPHETKLRLQQMFGYGSGAPTQAATPDQGVQQAGPPGGFDPRMGSGYYGAF